MSPECHAVLGDFAINLTQIHQIYQMGLSNGWRDRSTTSETLIYG